MKEKRKKKKRKQKSKKKRSRESTKERVKMKGGEERGKREWKTLSFFCYEWGFGSFTNDWILKLLNINNLNYILFQLTYFWHIYW